MLRSPHLEPRSHTRGRAARGPALVAIAGWGLGLLLAGALVVMTVQFAGRWLSDADAAGAGHAVPAYAPALPDDGGPFMAGTSDQAQREARQVASAFADCVFRAGAYGSLAGGAPPPYLRCDTARALGLPLGSIDRRGTHGPIDGRGAREALGIFTVHRGREAFLLQYDAAGRGWGFSFDAYGQVAAVCRTVKGRECWYAEAERPGALFLGDSQTTAILAAMVRQGRAPR